MTESLTNVIARCDYSFEYYPCHKAVTTTPQVPLLFRIDDSQVRFVGEVIGHYCLYRVGIRYHTRISGLMGRRNTLVETGTSLRILARGRAGIVGLKILISRLSKLENYKICNFMFQSSSSCSAFI